jgi:hypothetical protein
MESRTGFRYGEQAPALPKSTMHALIYVLVNAVLWLGVLAFTWPLLQFAP